MGTNCICAKSPRKKSNKNNIITFDPIQPWVLFALESTKYIALYYETISSSFIKYLHPTPTAIDGKIVKEQMH